MTRQGELLVNELAPLLTTATTRANVDVSPASLNKQCAPLAIFPLGSTELITPAAIVNLLGEVWLDGDPELRCGLGRSWCALASL